jgi:hypothetical protein
MVDHDEMLRLVRTASPVPTLDHVDADDLTLLRELVGQGRSTMTTPLQQKPTGPFAPLSRKRAWQKPALVFGLAMALILVVFGVTTVFLGGAEDIAPADEPTPAVTQTTPLEIPEEVAVPSPPGETAMVDPEWTVVSSIDEGFTDGYVTNIASVGEDLFAVGAVGQGCSDDAEGCGAAIWRSDNGSDWQQVFLELDMSSDPGSGEATPSTGDEARSWLWDITHGPSGYLAVGEYLHYTLPDEPALFASADGFTWTSLDSEGIHLGGARPRGLVATSVGYLLAGQSCTDLCSAAIWSSPDGATWERVLDHPVEGSSIEMLEEINGQYFAAGGERDSGLALIWVSDNGADWQLVSADHNVFATPGDDGAQNPARWVARHVSANGPGIVAVGVVNEEGGATSAVTASVVWTSTDGVTWVRAVGPESFPGIALTGVAELSGELIAVGWVDGIAAAWRTSDGADWAQIQIDPTLVGSDSGFWEVTEHDGSVFGVLHVDGRPEIWAMTTNG